MTDETERAARVAADRLAHAYEVRASALTARANRLRTSTLEELARWPVPYASRSSRALEDALDEALTAL